MDHTVVESRQSNGYGFGETALLHATRDMCIYRVYEPRKHMLVVSGNTRAS